MTFEELDNQLREKMKAQPYGYQSELARKLGVTRSYVSHVVKGRSPISREHYQGILDSLGLEVLLQVKGQPSEGQ